MGKSKLDYKKGTEASVIRRSKQANKNTPISKPPVKSNLRRSCRLQSNKEQVEELPSQLSSASITPVLPMNKLIEPTAEPADPVKLMMCITNVACIKPSGSSESADSDSSWVTVESSDSGSSWITVESADSVESETSIKPQALINPAAHAKPTVPVKPTAPVKTRSGRTLVKPEEPKYDYMSTRYGQLVCFLKKVYADESYALSIKHIKLSSCDELEYSGLILPSRKGSTPAFNAAMSTFHAEIKALLRPKGEYISYRNIPLEHYLPLYSDLLSVCRNLVTITMPPEWEWYFPLDPFKELDPRIWTGWAPHWIRFGFEHEGRDN